MAEFEMEPNAYFEWDASAWDYFRTCPEMVAILKDAGEQIRRTAEGLSRSGIARYDVSVDEYEGSKGNLRAVVTVHPDSFQPDSVVHATLNSNREHNSLVVGRDSAHV